MNAKKIIGKYFLGVFLIFIGVGNIKAQDTIYEKGGSIIIGKILEVNLENIKYKKYYSTDSVVVTERKDNLLFVKYSNETKEFFFLEISDRSKQKSDRASKIIPIDKFPISFYQGEYRINSFQLDNKKIDDLLLAKNNSEISGLVNKSHKIIRASRICTFSIIPLGLFFFYTAIAGSDVKYLTEATFGVGSLCLTSGIIFAVRGKSKRRQAVDLYNKTYFDY